MVTALLLLFERAAADAEQRVRTDLSPTWSAAAATPPYGRRAPAAGGSTSAQPHVVLVARGHAEASRRALVMSAHAAVGEAALVG